MAVENVEQNKRHDQTEERLDLIEGTFENLESIPGNLTSDLEYLESENVRNSLI